MTITTGIFQSFDRPISYFYDGEPKYKGSRTGRVDCELSDDGKIAKVTGTVLVLGKKGRHAIEETMYYTQTAKDGSMLFKNKNKDVLFVEAV